MHLKQDRMTARERMEALFAYEKPDRVPVGVTSTGFNTKNAGFSVADAYTDPEKSFESMMWTTEQYGWDPIPQVAGHTLLGAWNFGGQVRLPKGEYEGALMVMDTPVKVPEDIDTLAVPDPKTSGRIPEAMAFAKLQAKQGLPVYFFSRSPFTMAANIAGIDQFLRWTIRNTDACEKLLRLSIDHIFNVMAYWVETFGGENIFAWMSSPNESNQLISPRILKKFALPYHREYHKRLDQLDIKWFGFHICGEQNMNLPLSGRGFSMATPGSAEFRS